MDLGIILLSGIVMKNVSQCNTDLFRPRMPTHIWGFTIHAPWMHHYLHCCCILSQHWFINLVGCRASLHVPACIFYNSFSTFAETHCPTMNHEILTTLPTSQHRSALELFPTFFIQAQRNDRTAVSAGGSALTCVRRRVPACAEAPDPPTRQPMCQLSAHVKTICRKSKSVSAWVRFHFECSSDRQLAWTHVLCFQICFALSNNNVEY